MKKLGCLLLAMMLFAACKQESKRADKVKESKKDWDKSIPGSFSEQSILKLDSNKLDSFFVTYPALKNYANEVRSFYRERNFSYAWYENNQMIEQAGNLANRLMNLEDDGVYRKVPYQQTLDSLIHGPNGETESVKPSLNLELMLTAQYFAFASMVYDGVDASLSDASGWNVPRKKVDYKAYLDSLLSSSTTKMTDEPVYRQYELLKGFLRKYRALDSTETWEPINASKLGQGDSSIAVKLIKRRLFLLDDYHGDTTETNYSNTLTDAVQCFQERNGLNVNGKVDPPTLAALNIPVKKRIVQLLVNMERSRWLPVSISSKYLAVNIPEFKLHVYDSDSLLWSCNVVVGKTTHPTTIFSGKIKYVVFSPYWNIPQSIVRNEVLPGMRRNGNYLSAHRMEITGRLNGLPMVRQLPGESNSLGLVKFLFPNSYNIYLHDTPSRSLFGETSRAFSHGCIRVKEPARLAEFLLPDSTGWNPEKISTAMHSGKEQYVTLKEKVPVFIAYFTAFINRENKLNFRKDIYNLDDRLADMLMSGHNNKSSE